MLLGRKWFGTWLHLDRGGQARRCGSALCPQDSQRGQSLQAQWVQESTCHATPPGVAQRPGRTPRRGLCRSWSALASPHAQRAAQPGFCRTGTGWRPHRQRCDRSWAAAGCEAAAAVPWQPPARPRRLGVSLGTRSAVAVAGAAGLSSKRGPAGASQPAGGKGSTERLNNVLGVKRLLR